MINKTANLKKIWKLKILLIWKEYVGKWTFLSIYQFNFGLLVFCVFGCFVFTFGLWLLGWFLFVEKCPAIQGSTCVSRLNSTLHMIRDRGLACEVVVFMQVLQNLRVIRHFLHLAGWCQIIWVSSFYHDATWIMSVW